jgi:mRNA-degrading endonuclease RelE of RelBE toxin-antitoxin system
MSYKVLYARQFHEQLMELPDAIYDKIEHSVDLLADNPNLLRDYDPPYAAARPPVDCKWHFVPGTFKVVYLSVNEGFEQMRFLFIGDTREDPLHRFDRMQ